MVYYRRGRNRIWPIVRNRLIGAAVGSGIHYGKKAAGAVGRALYRGYIAPFTKARRTKKMRRRRIPRGFLKQLGMTENKVVVHHFRGSYSTSSLSCTSTMAIFPTFKLNNPYLPAPGLSAAWNSQAASGFGHMAGMYKKFTVLGARISVTLRPVNINNFAQSTAGTSTYTYLAAPAMKCGVHLSESSTLTADSLSTWTQMPVLGDKVKTIPCTMENNDRSVTLVRKWSLRKHIGKMGDIDDYSGTIGGNMPTKIVYAIPWIQVADMTTSPVHDKWNISWSVSFITQWKDLQVAESDMYQTPYSA